MAERNVCARSCVPQGSFLLAHCSGPTGHPSSPGLLVFPLTGTASPATSLVLVELPRKLSLRQGSRANGLFGRCNVRVIRGKKRGGASGKDGSSARQGPPC